MRTLVKAALTICLLTGSAAAADLPSRSYAPQMPLPVPFSWSGAYVGAQIGYSWDADSTKEFYTSGRSYTGVQFKYHPDTASAGALAGLNYQIDAIVIGVEGDFEGVNARGGFNDPGGRNPFDPGGVGHVKRDWQASVRGRIGYAMDRMMIYATGGAAFTDFNYHFYNPVARFGEGTKVSKTGFTVGAGVNYAITDHLILGVEYRFTDYGKFDYVAKSAFLGLTGEQDPTMNTVRATVSYKF